MSESSSLSLADMPAEVWAETHTALLYIFLLYLVQPFVFVSMLLNKPFLRRIAATAWFGLTFYLVTDNFKHAIGDYFHVNMMLAWWPFGILASKYIHALFDPNFQTVFHLSTFTRVALFCYCGPTLIFKRDKHRALLRSGARTKGLGLFLRGVLQIGILHVVASTVLKCNAQEHLPWWMCNILLFYQVALSQGGAADCLFNAPTVFWVGADADVLYMADLPVLTTSPRILWHRWSISTGFHFRRAVYEPLGGRNNQFVATFCTFAVNCILHVFWWGPIVIDKFAWGFAWVLIIGPMVALFVDKYVLQAAFPKGSSLYKASSWLLLQVLVALLVEQFFVAQGLPLTLTNFSLLNTGRL
jgi:hypothetical protein